MNGIGKETENSEKLNMRTKTLKTAVVLLGKKDHFDLIREMDYGTQNDITQKGMSLIMPMILGAIAGFMFSSETFEFGLITSVCVGLVLSFMIMIVDRSFLNKIGEATSSSKATRIVVSVLLALVSSSGIDLALYHNDIQEEIRVIAGERTNSELEALSVKLTELSQSISEKESEAALMKENYLVEMKTGVGQRAKAKKALYESMLEDASEMTRQRSFVADQMAKSKVAYDRAMVAEMQGSLLIKMEALHRVVFSSWSTGLFWIMLVLLVVLFDLLPLMVKNTGLNGYDQYMIAEVQRSLALHKPIDPEKARVAYEKFLAKQDFTRRGIGTTFDGVFLN